ncbi:hypothetical protein BJ741DRAFT_655382 [Chytriomyces cf. hyalinus JEL632]|nr:hypothetical protein BJ741DRAFT_655382 [Chytriomyces cf. hyalinus JEL632]
MELLLSVLSEELSAFTRKPSHSSLEDNTGVKQRIRSLQQKMSLKRRASLDSISYLQDATDCEDNGDDLVEHCKAPFFAVDDALSVVSRSAGLDSAQFGVDLLRMFKCPAEGCSSSFASQDVYLDHKGKRHDDATVLFMNATRTRVIARDANGLLNCPCGHRGFTYLNGMLKHAKNCAGETPVVAVDPTIAPVKAFKCSFEGCTKSYGSKTGLSLHLKSKHLNSQSDSPRSSAAGRSAADESKAERMDTPEALGEAALQLEQSPTSPFRTLKAEENGRSTPSTPALTFKCPSDHCTQAFASKKGLALHKSKTHGDAIVTFLDSTESTVIRRKNDVLSCLCTEFVTNSNQEMARHVLQCTGSPKCAAILLEAAAIYLSKNSSTTPLHSEHAERGVSPAATLIQSTDTPSFSADDETSLSPQRLPKMDSEREDGEVPFLVGNFADVREGENVLSGKEIGVDLEPARKKARLAI